jgi:hypothetical protein
MPPRGGTTTAGQHWDAVAAAVLPGTHALATLTGHGSQGPCFAARDAVFIVWLIPVGAADGWPGDRCSVIRDGEPLVLPPPEQWLRPPRRELIDPDTLYAALVRGTAVMGVAALWHDVARDRARRG